MSIKRTLQLGDPRLKKENIVIDNFKDVLIQKVIQDLKDTMIKNDLVGMAAPQIGYNYRIFITNPRKTKARKLLKSDKLRIYINPKIVSFSKKENLIYEGCGSVMHGELFGPVKRPSSLIIRACDENGSLFELKCNGILARVIQHENDHMDGIEFTEKIADYKKLMSREFYVKTIRNSKEQLEASNITVVEYRKVQ